MKVLLLGVLLGSQSFALDLNPLRDLPTITPEQMCVQTRGMVALHLGVDIYDHRFDGVDCEGKTKEAMALLAGIQQKGDEDFLTQKSSILSASLPPARTQPYCTLNTFRPMKAMVLVTPLINKDTSSCHQSCINAAATQCDENTKAIPYICDFVDPQASIKVTPLAEGKVLFKCVPKPATPTSCWFNTIPMGEFSEDRKGEEDCANAAFSSLKPTYKDYKAKCFDDDGLPVVSGEYRVLITVDLGGKKYKKKPYEFSQNCAELKKATATNPVVTDAITKPISK